MMDVIVNETLREESDVIAFNVPFTFLSECSSTSIIPPGPFILNP